jgi:hypothetical protein
VHGDVADAEAPDLGVRIFVDQYLRSGKRLVGDGVFARLNVDAEDAAIIAWLDEGTNLALVKLRAAAGDLVNGIAALSFDHDGIPPLFNHCT